MSGLNMHIMYCGATIHMCKDKSQFNTLDMGQTNEVCTATKNSTSSKGTGEVKVNIDHNRNIKLSNVLYVPEFRNNLLSVPTITQHGYTVVFKENVAKVKRKDNTTVLTAHKQGGLYIVKPNEEKAMHVEEQGDKLTRWHQRLGHLNFNDVKKLYKENMVTGMTIRQRETLRTPKCEQCDISKVHQLLFKESDTREKDILGLIHTDICGPFSTSLGGAKYFATFIDDKTRYVSLAILKEKSEIFNEF